MNPAGRIRLSLQWDGYGWVARIDAERVPLRVEVFGGDPEDTLRLAVAGWRSARRARVIARQVARKKLN